MAEQNPNATPPASSGGINQEQLNKAVEAAVAATLPTLLGKSIEPITKAIETLQSDQKILGDTLAKLPPAGAEKKGEGKKEGDAEGPKFLTAEDLTKVLDERESKRTASQTKQAARQKVIDAKLAKVPGEFLAGAPDTDDEAQLNAWADKVIARVNEVIPNKQPDVKGAAADGGTKPQTAAGGQTGFLKMPGAPTQVPAGAAAAGAAS